MTQLWDLSHIKPNSDIVLPGETIPALFWNMTPARCKGVPTPAEAMFNAPGFDFASAMSSSTVVALLVGLTTRT